MLTPALRIAAKKSISLILLVYSLKIITNTTLKVPSFGTGKLSTTKTIGYRTNMLQFNNVTVVTNIVWVGSRQWYICDKIWCNNYIALVIN